MLTEKTSALERFDGLGVRHMEDDRAESGAEDVDRLMRTRMRPLPSVSDSVRSGSLPSSEMTSSSSSILEMVAAVGPGNWALIRRVAALYSKRKSRSVYLQTQIYLKINYCSLHEIYTCLYVYVCVYIIINYVVNFSITMITYVCMYFPSVYI